MSIQHGVNIVSVFFWFVFGVLLVVSLVNIDLHTCLYDSWIYAVHDLVSLLDWDVYKRCFSVSGLGLRA